MLNIFKFTTFRSVYQRQFDLHYDHMLTGIMFILWHALVNKRILVVILILISLLNTTTLMSFQQGRCFVSLLFLTYVYTCKETLSKK